MIERIWSGQSRLYLLLLPLSWLYGLVSALIRISWRVGLRTAFRAPLPVVVVGNLTAGGSGKTPLVIWLVEQLQKRGLRAGVVSRGYGGKSLRYPLVLTEQVTAEQAGDEPVLIFQRTGAPVAVSPKRAEAVMALVNQYRPDLIITDDGLQHYALQRDFEIAVIDGVRRFGNGFLLPAGPMRESAARLTSVNAIITNGGHAYQGEIPMILRTRHAINLLTAETAPLCQLQHIVAMAGTGYPARFFSMLENAGVFLEKKYAFRDHHYYDVDTLASLTTAHQTLLMTEKDAVKCRAFAQANWWCLPVDAELPVVLAEQLLVSIQALLEKSY